MYFLVKVESLIRAVGFQPKIMDKVALAERPMKRIRRCILKSLWLKRAQELSMMASISWIALGVSYLSLAQSFLMANMPNAMFKLPRCSLNGISGEINATLEAVNSAYLTLEP